MRKISALHVKKLREVTGASVMECRVALEKSSGDMKKAEAYISKMGREKAGEKSKRATGEGVIAAYIHSNKKVGAMVELLCETDFVAKNSEFQELAYDIAMHIAAMNPRYLKISEVPERDKREYEHMVREELAGEKKPADVVEKIISGKVNKHFDELCLLSQNFVKRPEITVENLIKEKISKIGENIRVGRFVRFEI